MERVTDFIFLGSKITADGDCSHEIKRRLLPGRKGQATLKSRDITWLTKVHLVKARFFHWSCMDVELDHKESWVLKNWCFWTVVLEKTLESPLDCKEIKPVHPKRNQSWIFIGRSDAEAETPILWLPDVKNWFSGKDPDAGKAWRQEKGTTEDDTAGWNHWLNGHEFEQAPGVGDGQQSLAVLQSMGSQRVGKEWEAELNWHFWTSLYFDPKNFQLKVYNLWPTSPHFPHPLAPGNHHSNLCFYEFTFLDSTLSDITQYLSFSVWLISFSIMSLRSISIVENSRISFFLMPA